MGNGYCFSCKQCRNHYSASFGFGKMYPEVYREFVQKITNGEYGEERKQLLKDTLYAAVDAENVDYRCKNCDYWEVGQDATLYAPNDPKALARKEYGTKTVEEWGRVPFALRFDLDDDYHVLKRYYHKCCKCGKRMHKAADKELQQLPCPKCGCMNTVKDTMLWD